MLHCTMTGGWDTDANREQRQERKFCPPHLQVGIWGELYLRTHRRAEQRLRLCSEHHIPGDVLSSRSGVSTPLANWAFTTHYHARAPLSPQLLSGTGWGHHHGVHSEQVFLSSCDKLGMCVWLKEQEYRGHMAASTDHCPSEEVLWVSHTPGSAPLVSKQLSCLEYPQG